jgi:hypothetical protein
LSVEVPSLLHPDLPSQEGRGSWWQIIAPWLLGALALPVLLEEAKVAQQGPGSKQDLILQNRKLQNYGWPDLFSLEGGVQGFTPLAGGFILAQAPSSLHSCLCWVQILTNKCIHIIIVIWQGHLWRW